MWTTAMMTLPSSATKYGGGTVKEFMKHDGIIAFPDSRTGEKFFTVLPFCRKEPGIIFTHRRFF